MDLSCLVPSSVGGAGSRAVRLRGPRANKRGRRLFLVFGLLTAAVTIPFVLGAAGGPGLGVRLALVAGLLGLGLWWQQSCRRGRLSPWGDAPEFALLFALGVAAGGRQLLALVFIGVFFRSLFTGPRRTAIGVAGYAAGHVAAVALTPVKLHGYGIADALLELPFLAMAAGVMHALAGSLQRYEALEREVVAGRAAGRFAALVRNASDLITVVEPDTTVRYQSPSVEAVLGFDEDELVGTKLIDLVHPDDREWVLGGFEEGLDVPGFRPQPMECRWRHRDGSYRLLESVRNNLLHDPHVEGVVLNSRDITAQRALEDELKHRAFHDSLTGLANRSLLEDRLRRALALAQRDVPPPALLFIDLDDFKNVNDSLGHAVGDGVLISVARRLSAIVRETDTLARFGGDEFALLLDPAPGATDVVIRAQELLRELNAPFAAGGRQLRVTGSIGIAIGSESDGADELLRNADLALYQAKNEGKNRLAVFRARMHDAAVGALEIEQGLRTALGRDELVLHYQPLMRPDGRISGFEALVRWQHPERGLLGPAAFLDVAERSRLIVPIGRWIVHEACRAACRWNADHPSLGPLSVGVNVAPAQLADASFIEDVRAALDESGLSPGTLVLEITENVVVDDGGITLDILHGLKALGVRLAIDDFGTGYSSLAYLQRLPLDTLKIPRPFVAAMGEGATGLALARGIAELARSLGLQIVAEGIETAGQLEQVWAIGCDLAQGYLLARPAEPLGVEAILASAVTAQAAAA